MTDEEQAQPAEQEEVVVPPEAFTNPYVLAALDKMPKSYLVSIHSTPTIKWGGLLYLLHCFGQPIFKTTDLSAEAQKGGIILSSDKTYCVRYEAELRFVPNDKYLTALGLPLSEFGRLTGTLMQFPTTAQGSATANNVRTSNMAVFARELAETRAKCRAARDFLGVGICSTEEMGDDGETAEAPVNEMPAPGNSIKGMASRTAPAPVTFSTREDRLKYIRSRQKEIACLDTTIAFLNEKGKKLLDQLTDEELADLCSRLQKM